MATLGAFLVLPQGHALARRRGLSLAALADETFVTFTPGTVHHELQQKALAQARVAPRRTLSASTTETILGLVAAGVGCSLVPSLGAAGLQRSGVVSRPYVLGRVRFPVTAVWCETSSADPTIVDALAAIGSA